MAQTDPSTQSAFATLDQQSPFGAKPQQLDQPEPGVQDQQDLAQSVASDAQAEIVSPDEFVLPGESEAPDDEFLLPGDEPEEALAGQEDFPIEPRSESLITDIYQQLETASARFKASFAMTPPEKSGLLTKIFGDGNVKRKDGEFFIKPKGSDKFRKFDQDGFELIGDILDFSREAVEEVVALPAEIGGAVAGSLAGPVGTAGGALAGRVASTPAQIKVADAVGEFLGIERDPERSFAMETAIAGGLNLALPIIGKGFKALATKGGRAVKEGLTGAPSKSRLAQIKPTPVELSADSKQLLQHTQELKDLGLVQNIPGTNTPMLLWQIHPDAPQSIRAMKDLADEPKIINALNAQAEAFNRITKDTLQKVGDVKGLDEPISNLSKRVVSIVDTARKAEGSQIGAFRAKALKNIGANTKLPVNPSVVSDARSVLSRLGFKFKTKVSDKGIQKIQAIAPDKLPEGALGLVKPGELAAIGNAMTKVVNEGSEGLTLGQYKNMIEVVGDRFKLSKKIGGELSSTYGRLSSNLRGSRNEAIMSGLDNEAERQSYLTVTNKFKDILDTSGSLARSLDDELSSNNFVKSIISGKSNLESFKAAKSLLKEDHPDVWRRVTGDFLDELIAGSPSPTKIGFDPSSVNSKLRKLGKEFQNELFEGSGVKRQDFNKLMLLGQRINRMDFNAVGKDQMMGVANDLTGVATGSGVVQSRSFLSLLGVGEGKNTKILKVLDDEGIDLVLKKVKGEQKNRARKMWEDALAYAKANRLISGATTAARVEAQQQLGGKGQ